MEAVTTVAATFSLNPQEVMGWRESQLQLWFTFAVDHTEKRQLSEALDLAAATWDPETLSDRLPGEESSPATPPEDESPRDALKRAKEIREMKGRKERPEDI